MCKSLVLAAATAPRCSENKSLWWWALWFPGNRGVASPVVQGNRRLTDVRVCVGCEQQQVREGEIVGRGVWSWRWRKRRERRDEEEERRGLRCWAGA